MIKIAFAVCLSIPFFFRFYFVPRDLPPFPTRRSSDLVLLDAGHNALVLLAIARAIERGLVVRDVAVVQGTCVARTLTARFLCRSEERRVGKSVDLGGRRIIKKKRKKRTYC